MIVDVTPFLTKRGGVFILSDITTPGTVHRMASKHKFWHAWFPWYNLTITQGEFKKWKS